MKVGLFFVIVGLGVATVLWVKSSYGVRTALVTVGRTAFTSFIADTPIGRTQGLSGHAPLSERGAMLFVFDRPTEDAFWMQGMLFPLDFVWISRGEVVGVTENARPMSETGFMLYRPPMFVDRVLEINAGAARKFGIRAGDKVHYKE